MSVRVASWFGILIATAGLGVPEVHAAPPSGQWSYDIRILMKKPMPMPERRMQHTECGQYPPAMAGCRYLDFKLTGQTLTWTVDCSFDGEKVTAKGKATYTKNTMVGEVIIKGKVGGQEIHWENHTRGRFLGPCPRP